MCMTVSENLSRRPIKLKKCVKVLREVANFGAIVWVTPYRNMAIPSHGFLFPRHPRTNYSFSVDTRIHGGVIHAYKSKQNNWSVFNKNKRAYAFNILAKGKRGTLVAECLYIPCCDENKVRRRAMVKFLETCLRSRGKKKLPAWKDLKKQVTKKVFAGVK